jgi:transposase
MKRYRVRKLQQRRALVEGRFIVGIDPAKERHDAVIVDPGGIPVGRSFSFKQSFTGLSHDLWQRISLQVPELAGLPRSELQERLIFAIENSCNLWINLADWLSAQGCQVVLVNPLATHHERPSRNGDFTHSDERDAFLVGDLAREGKYQPYECRAADFEAMQRLSIAYGKLRRTLQQSKTRLRSEIELVFPELLSVLKLNSLTARHLVAHYLLPQDYLELDIHAEAANLSRISRNQHGAKTLLELQRLARHSVGIRVQSDAERAVHRSIATTWLDLLLSVETETQRIADELVLRARQTPWHGIITSLKGISDLTAALFIAEVGDLGRIAYPGQIERRSGIMMRPNDSGTFKGHRRISRIGNKRLRWVLFQMVVETVKYVPEVRAKYLRRQLGGHTCRRKNLIATVPTLLKLILALIRDARPYQLRDDAQHDVASLEHALALRKKKATRRKWARAA